MTTLQQKLDAIADQNGYGLEIREAMLKAAVAAVREAHSHVLDTISMQFCNEEYSEGFGDALDYVEAYANNLEAGDE